MSKTLLLPDQITDAVAVPQNGNSALDFLLRVGIHPIIRERVQKVFISETIPDDVFLQDVSAQIRREKDALIVRVIRCLEDEIDDVRKRISVSLEGWRALNPVLAEVCKQFNVPMAEYRVSEVPLDEIVLPDALMDSICAKIENQIAFMRFLAELQAQPFVKDKLLPFIREVQRCMDHQDSDRLNLILRQAIGNPDLTIAEDQSYLLAALSYFPPLPAIVEEIILTNFALGIANKMPENFNSKAFISRLREAIDEANNFDLGVERIEISTQDLSYDVFNLFRKFGLGHTTNPYVNSLERGLKKIV